MNRLQQMVNAKVFNAEIFELIENIKTISWKVYKKLSKCQKDPQAVLGKLQDIAIPSFNDTSEWPSLFDI
jgi:hypothetical protein